MFDNQSHVLMFTSIKGNSKKNSIDAPTAAIRGNHKMAVIDEGEDLTETGEEVIAKVK